MGLQDNDAVRVARFRFTSVLRLEKSQNFEHDSSGTSSVDDETYCTCPGCVCKSKDLGNKNSPCLHYAKKQKLESTGHKGGFDSRKTNYTLKLFDRTVDLAQFEETTPLYSICREWVKNKPNRDKGSRNREESATEENEQIDYDQGIYQLPPPKPLQYRYDVYGKMISSRIPHPLPATQDTKPIWSYIKIHSTGDDYSLPSPAAIFQNNLRRWMHVRKRWKKACAENERRFEASLSALQKMHRVLPLSLSQP